jgi:hypothetical protein
MSPIRRLLAGEIPAREAFWTWQVSRGLPVNLACTLAALVLVVTAADGAIVPLWLAAALHVAAVPYNAVCLLGVWRGIDRQEPPGREAALLRAASVAVFVFYLAL